MGHTIFHNLYASIEFQTGKKKQSWSLTFHPIPNYCKYRSNLAYSVICLLFWWASNFSPNSHFRLLFSLSRIYKRLVQPCRGFPRLYRYSETFLRTFITLMHTQSLSRSLDANTFAGNWSFNERRFRYLERTVLGNSYFGYHTVNKVTLVTPRLKSSPTRLLLNSLLRTNRMKFPHYCPFVSGIDRSPMDFIKFQYRGMRIYITKSSFISNFWKHFTDVELISIKSTKWKIY